MPGFQPLNLIKPALALLPEVTSPDRKVLFKTRALWTVIIVLIYLVAC